MTVSYTRKRRRCGLLPAVCPPCFPGRRPPVPCCRSSNPEPRFPVGRYGCRSWEPCPPSSRILSPYTTPKAAAYASGCRPIEPCWCCRGENIGRPGSSESHSACRFHFHGRYKTAVRTRRPVISTRVRVRFAGGNRTGNRPCRPASCRFPSHKRSRSTISACRRCSLSSL